MTTMSAGSDPTRRIEAYHGIGVTPFERGAEVRKHGGHDSLRLFDLAPRGDVPGHTPMVSL
ncbi:hypothetical protein [Actinokineospora xionganensis]|uniref:Uncharacterized protein n=1 Tax=Actinokineospora xionganensis TaxID=2684470 RepID=A0ABR7L5X4_9PSEU|nr:hypothetical protein [Actinokineospora xionganensis]MBC6447987.1 hypothetical protein [Actinokineospora xionganensis]